MLERFKNYFGKLERLSDCELDRSAEKLVCAEKQNVAKLIAHIAEMSRRKVTLELGYKSTFHYCVERLHLSEGSVASRIHVANVSIRFPQLLVALAENRISLTVAGLLAPHLSEDNVDTLLADCAGMTKKAALEYLVRIEPKPVFEPSIRRRPARPVPVEAAPAERPAVPPRELTQSKRQLSPSSPNILQPARPTVFNFRFSADRSFKEKFERLAEVMGVENAQKHMAEILEQALDIALEKKDPKRKLERRKARQQRRENTTKAAPRPEEMSKNVAPGVPRVKDQPARSRYIPSEAIERVHARGNHQCEFKSDDGRRCQSRTRLQVEHERPFAIFRSHNERFRRLLCPPHNRLAAEHVYGAEFIQRKIDERRGVGKCRSTEHRCLELHNRLRRAANALGFTITPDTSGT